jgi:hypothetical protein
MYRKRHLPSLLIAAFSLLLVACGGSSDVTDPPPPPPPAVATTVQIAPDAPILNPGQAQQLSATVRDAAGQVMTGQAVTWSTSDAAKVSVSTTGLVTGLALGSATITARAGNVQATVTATVARPTLQFAENASVSGVIGPAGGAITAQGANNTTYTLTVPSQALDDSVNITLTPVASFGATTLHGAVRMRPSGLRFILPATLTVDLPSPPANTAQVVGFHFSDDGENLIRYPVGVTGSKLQFVIGHFSGVGGAGPTMTTLLTGDGSPSDLAASAVATAAATGDVSALIAAFRTWYTTGVKPLLAVANTNDATYAAIAEWQWWVNLMEEPPASSFLGQITTALGSELTEARNLAATAIQLAIIRANAACIANEDFLSAYDVLNWQQRAERTGLATPEFALDRPTVMNDLCIRVRYASVTLPDTLRPGRAATLRVQVGLSFGGGAAVFTSPPVAFPLVEVSTTPNASTNDSTRKTLIDGIGVVTRQVAPADTTPMSVAVRSCINPVLVGFSSFPELSALCADTTIGRLPTNSLYFSDFTSGPLGPEWNTTQVAISPSGERFLGELGNGSTTLSLNSLPAHTQLVLEFDIYIIDSWNGNGGQGSASAPDLVEVSVVGGASLKKTTFSNKPSDLQAFPGDYPGGVFSAGTGALGIGTLGYPPDNDPFGSSAYRLKLTFNHTSGIIALRFVSQQTSGQNERWGLDNVRLSLVP